MSYTIKVAGMLTPSVAAALEGISLRFTIVGIALDRERNVTFIKQFYIHLLSNEMLFKSFLSKHLIIKSMKIMTHNHVY